MREAPGINVQAADTDRIIPADAGSTSQVEANSIDFKDHPRGCGEHKRMLGGIPDGQGSSPRMRGALYDLPWSASGIGIIPADAGSTVPIRSTATGIRDHPRGCGEHAAVT